MIFTLDGDHDGATNMARDEALLESGEVACRVYGWSSVWVTLGRAQVPELTLVDPSCIPWTIRPTGGAAVLHGHDLTIGLAVPMRHSVRGSYRLLAEPIVLALRAAGCEAALAEDVGADDGDPRRIDCFAGSSSNDIVDTRTGNKVCGCALRRTREAVLLQASIPVSVPPVDPAVVIRGGVVVPPVAIDREVFVNAFRSAIANLNASTS